MAGHPSTDFVKASVDKTAEEQDDDPLDTIDFKLCFDILAKNRKAYNRYNDSIFLIKEHDKWVNYFRRRAIKNHQIFAANQEIMRGIKEFLTKYNPQNEMFSHLGTKRYNFKNETQLFKVIPHTSKFQKNRPASPERNTFEGS